MKRRYSSRYLRVSFDPELQGSNLGLVLRTAPGGYFDLCVRFYLFHQTLVFLITWPWRVP